jgi:hypothetical protein
MQRNLLHIITFLSAVDKISIMAKAPKEPAERKEKEAAGGSHEGKVSYPAGHWMGLGIAMGIPLGIPIGLLAGFSMDNLGVGMIMGPAFGVAIGTGIGWVLERRHTAEIRAFTPGEKKITKRLGLIGVGALAVGVAMLAYFSLF